MNNELIKVNKNIKVNLIDNNNINKSNNIKVNNKRFKKSKSNSKIYPNIKKDKTLKKSKTLKKNSSIDIYTLKINKNNIKANLQKIKNDKPLNQNNIIKRSLSGIVIKEKNNNINNNKKNNNNMILSIIKKRNTLNNNEIKSKNFVNNMNFKNKKENIYKHRHTLNTKDKIKLEKTNKENKNNFQNIFLRLKSEGNINYKNGHKCKTPNKYTKKTNIPKDIKEIEEQFNNIKNTVELMNKELEKIDKNNNFVNQNELKLKEIIGNLEKGDQLKKQLFKECINNTKEKILYNIIIMNNEKIKKVKEMKNEIDKIYVNISDFITNSKNENFMINLLYFLTLDHSGFNKLIKIEIIFLISKII